MLEQKIYKNYKELCKEFGWNPNNKGNYKKARLKELDTLCKWHKDGNKIVIDEIYNTPKDKEDNRVNNGGNNTSNYNEVDILLYNMLSSIKTDNTI